MTSLLFFCTRSIQETFGSFCDDITLTVVSEKNNMKTVITAEEIKERVKDADVIIANKAKTGLTLEISNKNLINFTYLIIFYCILNIFYKYSFFA